MFTLPTLVAGAQSLGLILSAVLVVAVCIYEGADR